MVKDNRKQILHDVGVHVGPVVAGIVGQERYQFDIWGDTVNVAARMVGKGKPGCVALTQAAWQRINDRFEGESLGELEVTGKGTVPLVEVRAERSRRWVWIIGQGEARAMEGFRSRFMKS